ncbi:DNA polymerase III subunit delta' [Sphingorhabdus sp. Alg239-R122]|uniref:DNA polymerase III subunit delta' n=1 Tax=Sphingorhabdus sp. Alg239-R122 TaxID=2305989 RepID=UPI0013DCA3FD|nr:DNA polymerase III subunit delta' [Sphingorhabdus sp. Alg239-R122]
MTSLYGHDAQQQAVLRGFSSGKMHHAWLLTGAKGVGKASFAWTAAQHILSREPAFQSDIFVPDLQRAGGQMLAAHNHPDCHYLAREPKDDKERRNKENGKPYERRRNIPIDQVRAMQQRLTTRPSLGIRRIIIIDSADNLERGAANALLKSLEEPPENTCFFLISHNPGKLLPTIRSRCMTLSFHGLNDETMRRVLLAQDESLTSQQLESLSQIGHGSPGYALKFLELGMEEIHTLMRKITETGDRDQKLRLHLAKLLSVKAAKEKLQAFIEYAPVFAARISRQRQGRALSQAIVAWEELVSLAEKAPTYNFTSDALVYQIGGLLARLAPPREAAA